MNVVTRALIRSAGIRTLVRPKVRHAVCVSVASSSRLARPYSTATTTTPAPGKLDHLVETLKSSRDLPSIHRICSALAAEVKISDVGPPATPSLNDNDRLLYVLQLLATSGRPEDFRLIEKILSDFHPILGITPSKTLYTAVLQYLADGGHEGHAHEFLLKIPRLPGQFMQDIEQVHLVLEACNQTSTFRDLIASIRRMNLTPTSQTFPIIFRTRWKIAKLDKAVPSIEELSSLIWECVQQGMPYDPAVADILYDIYATIGQYPQASAILDIYQSALTGRDNENPDEDSSSLAEPSSEKDLRILANSLAEPLDHPSLALINSLKSGNIEEAIHIYEQALEAEITPPDNVLWAFLKAVIQNPSSDQYLDKAIAISRHLADAVVPSPSTIPSSEVLPDRPYGPGLAIYHRLIRALWESPNTSKYSPILRDLLVEMKDRGLPTNTKVAAATKIILEMRRTGSFGKSMDTYRRYKPVLDQYGFGAVLEEYCRISFAGDLQVPLITEFFSIVQDMRLQRVPITPFVYNTFLHAIGMAATRIRQQRPEMDFVALERLVSSTRRVHDFLTVDASISPDATLLNQLMNTYQRLDCFAEACRLWEMMYLTGRYNQISVNIMLDACGYAGNLRMARSILTKLGKAGFKLDLRNWNTWVECLCRNNRFEEAVDVVLFKMGQNGHDPNMQSVRVLLKFVKRSLPVEQAAEVRRRVEAFLPHLWTRLPQEIRDP